MKKKVIQKIQKNDLTFKLPQNINIVYLEQAGVKLYSNDLGILFNWITSSIRENTLTPESLKNEYNNSSIVTGVFNEKQFHLKYYLKVMKMFQTLNFW